MTWVSFGVASAVRKERSDGRRLHRGGGFTAGWLLTGKMENLYRVFKSGCRFRATIANRSLKINGRWVVQVGLQSIDQVEYKL